MMTPSFFKCVCFSQLALVFGFLFTRSLHNDSFKQQYKNISHILPGFVNMDENSQVCRTLLPGNLAKSLKISKISPCNFEASKPVLI